MKKLLFIILLTCSLFTCSLLCAQPSPWNALGDTLTVIQRPILNIPAIHIPGEIMPITCLATQSTTGWTAFLLHGSKRIALPLQSATWHSNPDRWELSVSIPNLPVFELYDLEVNASGGIHDITQNAVKVLPSRKESYYFVHLTDLHLPNRLFYPNQGYDIDSTSVLDFRAVIDDINLINPEFVLITGDLINEGELENFEGQYWFGWAQRLIGLIEAPVFVTIGNHDVGGWNSTPPPQGSSRRNWWRYFGWNWLYNTDPNWNPHTQDYYFTYGNMLYIGLEAYDNYDNWLSYIYGAESFTAQQMAWLSATVNQFPNHAKVLFHHYDFNEQLSLNSLGIDMALWGHIHRNSGSIYTQPYNLATRSVCDENRSYRVIRVNGEQLTPTNTIYAGSSGTGIYNYWIPSNTGVADSVLAIVTNNQPLAFENTLLKFVMPHNNTGYNVTNGILEQVDRSGEKNVCYVRANVLANSSLYVSVAANGVSTEDPSLTPSLLQISAIYPNPMRYRASLELTSDKSRSVTVELYNHKGQKVQELQARLNPGKTNLSFVPAPELGSGIYFLKLQQHPGKPLKVVIVK
ncbi:MAG: metallophosphoesterase [Candidatus Cloacimonetes bacterium]|nr:metallophosphoesterase [Candidatus Cloacimonadota bacterium]